MNFTGIHETEKSEHSKLSLTNELWVTASDISDAAFCPKLLFIKI